MDVTLLLDCYHDTIAFSEPLIDELSKRNKSVHVIVATPPYIHNQEYEPKIIEFLSKKNIHSYIKERNMDVSTLKTQNSPIINLLKSSVPLYFKVSQNKNANSTIYRIFRGLGPGIFNRGTREAHIMGDYAFVYGDSTLRANAEFSQRLYVVGSLKVQYLRQKIVDKKNTHVIMALDNIPTQYPIYEKYFCNDAWRNFKDSSDLIVRFRHHVGSSPEIKQEINNIINGSYDELVYHEIEKDLNVARCWISCFGSMTAIESIMCGIEPCQLPAVETSAAKNILSDLVYIPSDTSELINFISRDEFSADKLANSEVLTDHILNTQETAKKIIDRIFTND